MRDQGKLFTHEESSLSQTQPGLITLGVALGHRRRPFSVIRENKEPKQEAFTQDQLLDEYKYNFVLIILEQNDIIEHFAVNLCYCYISLIL